ncbi:MAG TPA: 7-cyano-7-deazaguanine synthase QueC [Thermoplasmata archaeon]|jgi:7-cyano-7-deazaguanine synthase|nr:7-cyano-7-deazaguanine synthase QueC [Thermoplasmata archaeon]
MELRAVVLLSGGLDSTTALAIAASKGREIYALTVDYGQRHRKEIDAAKKVGKHFHVKEHKVLAVDLGSIRGSALTDRSVAVPRGRDPMAMAEGIPATYVPARNTILLGLALAYAESVDAGEVYIAANAIDYSGYPDCRPEFYEAFREVARLGTKRGVEGRPIEIHTPLIRMTKEDIVRTGARLGVPFALTWSCYFGRAKACGVCDSCQLRGKGFRAAGIEDPVPSERPPKG